MKEQVIFKNGIIRNAFMKVKQDDEQLAEILKEEPGINAIFLIDTMRVEKELAELKVFTKEDYEKATYSVLLETISHSDVVAMAELVFFAKLGMIVFAED